MNGTEKAGGFLRPEGHPRFSLSKDYDYIVLPGEPLSPKEEGHLASNTAFMRDILPSWIKDDEQNSAVVNATCKLMGFVLTSVDRAYGHDETSVGKRYLADPLGEESVPMFYHNGDTARLTLRETAREMDRRNRDYGDDSIFRYRNAYLAGVISAGAADLISDGARGEEENRTAALTESLLHMPVWGYDYSQLSVHMQDEDRLFTEVVKNTIIASTFEEGTRLQQGGDNQLTDVNNDGDLLILSRQESPLKTLCLSIEDLWRGATSDQWHRVLYYKARERNFVGRGIEDFFELIDEGYQLGEPTELGETIGKYLIGNSEFVDPDTIIFGRAIGHQYKDRNLQRLTRQQRKENAEFQQQLGFAIHSGRITVREAYFITHLYSQSL